LRNQRKNRKERRKYFDVAPCLALEKKICLPAKALTGLNFNNIPSEFWMTLAEAWAATCTRF